MLTASLIQQGADVNTKDTNFRTPLHLAAWENAFATVEVLLKHGADVNAKLRDGVTPLHFAASGNAVETAEVLLKHGADVNAVNSGGNWTPLHLALRENAFATGRGLTQARSRCQCQAQRWRHAAALRGTRECC